LRFVNKQQKFCLIEKNIN